ncbi:conserved hypothetical protein [Crenothrix polyspora]|uniref:Uncharacterized protein n=1 Tax=Crenothrix polyspora TaxID=360316 RepID=A0A1R4HCA1_9GAMM|nr:BrnA antitoxin family protein [Crenothrix polyspora]SJM93829.1 conserved hypothetical protein [Crenothrix polyspora]
MKTLKQRAEFDDYELEEHYDFNEGIRGRFYNPRKIKTMLQLDDDVIFFLKKQAIEKHLSYQVLVNALLRDYMNKPHIDVNSQ